MKFFDSIFSFVVRFCLSWGWISQIRGRYIHDVDFKEYRKIKVGIDNKRKKNNVFKSIGIMVIIRKNLLDFFILWIKLFIIPPNLYSEVVLLIPGKISKGCKISVAKINLNKFLGIIKIFFNEKYLTVKKSLIIIEINNIINTEYNGKINNDQNNICNSKGRAATANAYNEYSAIKKIDNINNILRYNRIGKFLITVPYLLKKIKALVSETLTFKKYKGEKINPIIIW